MNTTQTTEAPETTGLALSRVVAALEATYTAIRANHPELPQHMAIVTGTGLSARGLTWGHHRADAWMPLQPTQVRRVAGGRVTIRIAHQGPRITEMFISGERLAEGAVLTVQTMLHECAHALGTARHIDHVAAGGRHTKPFVALANEMGLEYTHPKADPQLGFSAVTLRTETTEKYADVIAALGAEITVYLDTLKRFGISLAGSATKGVDGTTQVVRAPRVDKRDHNNIKLQCGCGTKIRASRKVAEQMNISCDECGEHFTER